MLQLIAHGYRRLAGIAPEAISTTTSFFEQKWRCILQSMEIAILYVTFQYAKLGENFSYETFDEMIICSITFFIGRRYHDVRNSKTMELHISGLRG